MCNNAGCTVIYKIRKYSIMRIGFNDSQNMRQLLKQWIQTDRPDNRKMTRQKHTYSHKNMPTLLSVVLCVATQSCLTLCDPMDCSSPVSSVHGDSPGKNTGVGCHALLQGIFPIQRSNPGLQHCGQILYCLNNQRIQKCWSGQSIPSPRDLLDPGI